MMADRETRGERPIDTEYDRFTFWWDHGQIEIHGGVITARARAALSVYPG